MNVSLRWLVISLAVMACAPLEALAEGQRLRVMAANTSSGRFQSYPHPGPGTRIFQALDPDVVLIQEFHVNATRDEPNGRAAVEAWVDEVFGPDFHWFREPGGDSIPNGVISRWPILESGEWRDSEVGNRDFAFARIDIPGEVDLWVVSVHLLTRSSGARDAQARSLVEAIRNHPVPEGDFLIVGGDFNTRRRNERAVETLSAVVDTLGPFPTDGADPPRGGTNSSRRKPYDWVLTDSGLEALEVAVAVEGLEFPGGLVFDSRIFSQEELDRSFPPVREGDCGAPQMQHMAVVRDFLLEPAAGPDFEVAAEVLDFGVAGPALAATERSLAVTVHRPVALNAVPFGGSHPGEFNLVSPRPGDLPVTLEAATRLVFSWTPVAADGDARQVTATLVTDGEPGSVEIELLGVAAAPEVGIEPRRLAARALCEASAALVAPWDEDLILVADNEIRQQLYAFELEDGELVPEVTLAIPDGDEPRDLEALARVGDSVLAIGSHSRGGACEERPRRQRMHLLAARPDGSLEEEGTIDSAETWARAVGSRDLATCVATLFSGPPPALAEAVCGTLLEAEETAGPASCRVLNIEGAFGTGDGRVWLGLRAPLAEGQAIALRLVRGLDAFRFDHVALLQLENRGIRELALRGTDLFGIAGPEEDADDPFALFTIPLEDLRAGGLLDPVILRRDLPTSSEGMVVRNGEAFITVDGADSGDRSRCREASGQYRIEVGDGG